MRAYSVCVCVYTCIYMHSRKCQCLCGPFSRLTDFLCLVCLSGIDRMNDLPFLEAVLKNDASNEICIWNCQSVAEDRLPFYICHDPLHQQAKLPRSHCFHCNN
uniref:Uncharacterized protein n=1 Tax=Anguilla anguilla TaxID=7936 RepID=A0A0E9QJ76_ANGAN